jgi:hypothetical protein
MLQDAAGGEDERVLLVWLLIGWHLLYRAEMA